MKISSSRLSRMSALLLGASMLSVAPSFAEGPTTTIKPEYILTLRLPLAPHPVSDGLRVVELPSGTAEGPAIKGKIIAPSADWVRVFPDGVAHLDVRALIQTDDQQLIYVSYNGLQKCPKDSLDKLGKGEALKAEECYFIVAPTFETKSEKYKWVNEVQALGKMVEFQRGTDPHVTYEIFAIK